MTKLLNKKPPQPIIGMSPAKTLRRKERTLSFRTLRPSSEAVKKFPNRDSSCTGAKRGQCFGKSPLSDCATAPHRVQRREVAWRGALNGVLRPRATVPAVLRRLGERHRPHQVVGERVPQRHCFYLIEPAHQKLCEPTPARNGVNTFG